MAISKKTKKVKQPLWFRIIKIFCITLACAILLAAIADRIKHYYWHISK